MQHKWIAFLITGLLAGQVLLAQDGASVFKSKCAACHTVNKGRLVGPDLANVHNRRSEDWIHNFVNASQTMIKSGDEQAVAIFEEYNQTIMPDQNLSDAEFQAMLEYIKANSPEEAATETAEAASPVETAPAEPEREATDEDILAGRKLFVGSQRFENGGPTCNSCHHVTNDKVVAGGALGKDLTEAHSRLTAAGISGILANPPFPAMQKAYGKRPLTEDEVFQLTAFLQDVDETRIYQHPRDYGQRLLYTGLIGAVCLFGIFPILWYRRKSNSVNKRIYDRQIKSS